MGIIDRVILSIYTFLLTFLSLGVILLSLRLISLDLVWTTLAYIYGHWETALVGAVFFLVSIRLLLSGLRSQKDKDAIIHHNDMGDIHISLDAVENLVEKVARHIRGVRGVKVQVKVAGQQEIKVHMKVAVSPESNVPTVTSDIQTRVHEYVKNTVGVELADIRIVVETISNEFKVRHRVE
ncbi:MAG TPA: alkaline shock response membrane anchor protein AmaP [Methylomusa anaerophila]|uniref:Alkaline shock protein 23 n=1 Tax=Methylomusa anaerophila TaxID=1930071 RepID=A0A348APB7_9FIRM|nr:alkaline shock response membrane anchor protein AmaP [Methylomusa anaerophila]BBB92915.1 hypothetical protein MAMMFC1_03623 [Methylomusa anaerophila]HML87249.1 alkaline shock response membrane anchor protein AmaP [Methylomusa anaerophila]